MEGQVTAVTEIKSQTGRVSWHSERRGSRQDAEGTGNSSCQHGMHGNGKLALGTCENH